MKKQDVVVERVLQYKEGEKVKIAVIGIGSGGIQTLCHLLAWTKYEIVSIHDPNIPITGIGESTNPTFIQDIQNGCDFNIYDSIQNADLDCSIKLGTVYKSWRKEDFVAPLLNGNVAIHMNTFKLKDWAIPRLKNKWGERFNEIHGRVDEVKNEKDCVKIKIDDKTHTFDYLIDCGGFPKELNEEYTLANQNVNHCLVHNKIEDGSNMLHTGHVATVDGWMFEVPLSTRISYGYLFNNTITDLETAKHNFSKQINVPEKELQNIEFRFRSFYTNNLINNRIIKNGNRAVFFEPLAANSLWLYYQVNVMIVNFLLDIEENYPDIPKLTNMINSYFVSTAKELEQLIAMKYHGGSTIDSEFWVKIPNKCKNLLEKSEHLAKMKNLKDNDYIDNQDYRFFYDYHALRIVDKQFEFNYIK